MENDRCYHCGEILPHVRDAFCGLCRKPLLFFSTLPTELAIQTAVLEAFTQWRESPPTVFRLFCRSSRSYLFLALVVGVATGLMIVFDAMMGAVAMLGISCGALIRDIGWFAGTVRVWPTQAFVTDWVLVEQLLADRSPNAPTAEQPEAGATATGIQDLAQGTQAKILNP